MECVAAATSTGMIDEIAKTGKSRRRSARRCGCPTSAEAAMKCARCACSDERKMNQRLTKGCSGGRMQKQCDAMYDQTMARDVGEADESANE